MGKKDGKEIDQTIDQEDDDAIEESTQDYDDEWDKLTNPDRDDDELEAKGEEEDDDDADDTDEEEAVHTGEGTAAEAKAGDTDEEDDDKGEPQSLEERFKELEANYEILTHQFDSERGRTSGLQRKLQQLRDNTPGRTPSEARMARAMQSPEEWKKFETEYPEMSKAISSKLVALRQEIKDEVKKDMQALIQPYAKDATDRRVERESRALSEIHPDWETIVGTKEFANWVAKQPESVKSLTRSENAADAAFLVTSYKNAAGLNKQLQVTEETDEEKQKKEEARKLKAKREQQKQDGAAVRTSTRTGRTGEASVDVDFDTAFAGFAKKKNKQLREQRRI